MKRTVLLLLITTAVFAQKPPTIELGFSPERVYSFGGIDNINAFNGNNVITLPLTLEYRVSNHLTYRLAVVYNSKVWDYRYYLDEFAPGGYLLWARPNIRSNAGVGWRVSMGRLLPPNSYTNTGDYKDDTHPWVYEGPSGDEHAFSSTVYSTPPFSENPNATVQFTTDGTFLRMRVAPDGTRKVEFPNGEIHTFTNYGGGTWRLTKIEDQFQHHVTVSYTPIASNPPALLWNISDTTGRAHTVRLTYFADMADTVEQGMNVDYLDMQGANSEVARYTFAYDTTSIDVDCHHNYPPAGTTTGFPRLTSITLPDNTRYDFSYYTQANLSCSQGLLKDLTLPTKGVISYTYQQYFLPPRGKCDLSGPGESSVGIKTRTVDGSEWKYLQTYGPAEQTTPPTSDPQFSCGTDESGTNIEPDPPHRWARTSILTPPDATGARSRTDHYFSVYNGAGGSLTHVIPGLPLDYGDPMSFGKSPSASLAFPPNDGTVLDIAGADDDDAPSTTRLISEEVWNGCDATGNCTAPLRATYRRNADVFADQKAFRQIKSERTVFKDDTGCLNGTTRVACYVQHDYSSFDRVGHWRTTTTTSNFPTGTSDARTTTYDSWTDVQLNNANTKWVFNKFTETTRTNGTTMKATFCFSETGLLLGQRALANSTGAGSHDVLTRYDYFNGNVTDERTYGGDRQTVSTTTDLCNITGSPEYWTRYTYTDGLLTATQPLKPSGVPVGFKTADYTRDATGLITTSRGTDSLATTYAYKRWGAIESVTPPSEATTTFTYTAATTTTPATVESTRDPIAGPTTDDVKTTYAYDRIGRLKRTSKTLPGAGCTEQITTYDAQGRKDTHSVWKQCTTTGAVTTYRYDAFDRLTSITTPDMKTTSTTYTGTRVVTRTSEIGSSLIATREEYDALGRLIKVTENADTNPADGITGEQTTTYTYDAADRLVTVTMPGSQTRTFTYDGRGFLTSEIHPELGANGYATTSYLVDSRGHTCQKTNGTASITMTYDAAERVTAVTETSTSRLLKQFVYDVYDPPTGPHPQCTGNGAGTPTNTICLGKLAVAARYQYDPDLGNPTTHQLAVTESYQYHTDTGKVGRYDRTIGTIPGRFTGHTFVSGREYDALGNTSRITYPCATGWTCTRDVRPTYTYGSLTSVSVPGYEPWASNITYQPNGLASTVTHGTGTNTVYEIWTPDAAGMSRPARITATNSAGTTLWTTGGYAYDGSGNITRIGDPTGNHTTYQYDPFGRLATWTSKRADGSFDSVGQGYDAYGNHIGKAIWGCGPLGPTYGSCYGSSTVGAEIVGTTNHYAGWIYDDAGNVTTVGSRSYTYDALGVLTRLDDPQIKLRFLYTPDDERIAAIERVTGTDGITRNKTTYTLRGFDNQLLSIWTVDPVTDTLAWREDAIWRGTVLLARESMTGTTNYSLDHLGSPRAITNFFGTLVGVQEFAPFGTGGTSNGGALQFTGHERDAANLGAGGVALPDYFHARYYDLEWGRFLSVDPEVDASRNQRTPQRWNRYVYAANNPITLFDPDGKKDTIYVVNALTNGAFNDRQLAALNAAVKGTRFEGRVRVFGPMASHATVLRIASRADSTDMVGILIHSGRSEPGDPLGTGNMQTHKDREASRRARVLLNVLTGTSLAGAVADGTPAGACMIAGCSSDQIARTVTTLAKVTTFGTDNYAGADQQGNALVATLGALARGATPAQAAAAGDAQYTRLADCSGVPREQCDPTRPANLEANVP